MAAAVAAGLVPGRRRPAAGRCGQRRQPGAARGTAGMMALVTPDTETRLDRLERPAAPGARPDRRVLRRRRLRPPRRGGGGRPGCAGAGGDRSVAEPAVRGAAERREFARARDIRHLEVCTTEEERPGYVANGGDRCYHCKSALFDALAPLAEWLDAPIALGTNLDDLGEHRPGQRAAAERGVVAPLVDAGFTKQDVREVSELLGLATATKPAAACLASRVAYGDPVTPELLARIEAAEEAVRSVGFSRLPGPGACRRHGGPDRGAVLRRSSGLRHAGRRSIPPSGRPGSGSPHSISAASPAGG